MQEKGSGDYREEFVSLLNNSDKNRKAGFITFIHGATDLAPIEALCQEQSYNKCKTARYGAGKGRVLLPIVGAFLEDVRRHAERDAADNDRDAVGVFRPAPKEGEWESIYRSLQELALEKDRRLEEGLRFLDSFFAATNEVLATGDRLVLMCELSDLNEEATLDSIGLDKEAIAFMGDLMPERLGLVLSGIPEHLAIHEFGDRFRGLDVSGQDYGAPPKSAERAKPLKNDNASGDDKLQVRSEVHALADAIASKDMHPPLVAGILGGWGSGKSFVLHLLRERLFEIRGIDVTSKEARDNSPYVGHFYLVHFNAWTYAKSNLWASLMQEILVELNHQIGVEQLLEKVSPGIGLSGKEPWRLLQELKPRDFDQLQQSEIGREAIKELAALEKERVESGILWEKLRKLKTDEQEALETAEGTLIKKRRALAEAEAWEPFQKKLIGTLAETFRKAVTDDVVEVGDALGKAVRSIGTLKKIWAGISGRTIAFIAFTVLVAVVDQLINATDGRIATWIGALAGPMLAIGDALRAANSWIEDRVNEFESYAQQAQEERSEHGGRSSIVSKVGVTARVLDLEAEISELEAEVDRRRRNVGITARHPTLLDFIQGRLDRGEYEKHLGLLHQVQQDIDELSDGLFSHHRDADSNLFPRGEPRVILIIDDLDRCPPERVVEVLEAAKLLVGTSLFVVILAMDVRYITRSLEKAYRGVLVRDGTPSGLDYIEKIVQIPYRVPPIAPEAMGGYVLSLLDDKIKGGDGPGGPTKRPPGSGEDGSQQQFAEISSPGTTGTGIDVSLPMEVQEFDRYELEMLTRSTLAVALTPRSTKRLVNVVKLIKIIWYRRRQEEPDLRVKQAMVLLLTLSAEYPEIMRRLLLELENLCQRDMSELPACELAAVLGTLVFEWSQREGRSTDWEKVDALLQDQRQLDPYLTIEEMTLSNVQLVRSFSFVGEVDAPPDPEIHQLAVDVMDPVTFRMDEPPDGDQSEG